MLNVKTFFAMKTTLKNLQAIERELEAIGDAMRKETAIYEAERRDRLAKGISDNDAAIAHYNEWMRRYGLPTI